MNVDKLLKWLEKNKGIKCSLLLKKDENGKLDGKTIAITSFTNYDTTGDCECPILLFKNVDIVVLSIFLSDFQRFLVKNNELSLFIE